MVSVSGYLIGSQDAGKMPLPPKAEIQWWYHHVSIVIHNYRWRLGLAEGEPKYDDSEKRLAAFPVITVPAITLQGDADGAPRPDPSSYAKKFSGKYAHRLIKGGVGHNLSQEAPQAFAKAVLDVDRY